MKTICFYFQIHQPYRLKRYRFFDIGADHYYYDDAKNQEILVRIARNSYLPANETILSLIKKTKGAFKVAYSISGLALESLEQFCPEVIDSFKELAKTGCVEFLGETYAHSFAALKKESNEFELQVKEHSDKIQALFGQKPTVFRGTELLYSDDMAERILSLGFKGAVTEGCPSVLDGWRSPDYVYCSGANQRLKLLLKNNGISRDIAHKFSDCNWDQFPLTAEKLMSWISDNKQEQVVNIFMNYEVLGEIQKAESGIFEFLKALPEQAIANGIAFGTPSEVMDANRPVDTISVPYPITWASENDLSPWFGNAIQDEAYNRLFSIAERVRLTRDKSLLHDFYKLQSSDHLYYMSTSHYNQFFCPYDSPYDAFINYMNVASDFMQRVESRFPKNTSTEELNALVQTIVNLEKQVEELKGGAKPKAEKKAVAPKTEVKAEKPAAETKKKVTSSRKKKAE